MLAVEKAPTSQPARVKGTHGAGTFLPDGVVSAGVVSKVAGVSSALFPESAADYTVLSSKCGAKAAACRMIFLIRLSEP